MFDGKSIPLFVMNGRAYKFKYGKGPNPWEGDGTDPEKEPPARPPDPLKGHVRVRSLRSELGWSDVDFINTASRLGIVAKEFMVDGFRTPCVTREEYRKLRGAKSPED
jgi:hypothetical protein